MLAFQFLGCSVFTAPGPERYTATLKVDNALRPVTNAANGSGSALFSRRNRALDFSITVSGLSSHATAAHLHRPAASGAGEIIFSFSIFPGMTSARIAGGILSTAALPGVSIDSLLVLMRNGSAYVDVHTETNPAGEIIGQIGPESALESSQTRVP
jgi:CHRD domain-containing protein